MSVRNMTISCMKSSYHRWEVASRRTDVRRDVFLAAALPSHASDELEGRYDRRFERVELAFCVSRTFELGYPS